MRLFITLFIFLILYGCASTPTPKSNQNVSNIEVNETSQNQEQSKPASKLVEAIRLNDAGEVNRILNLMDPIDRKYSITQQGRYGDFALAEACLLQNHTILELLLNQVDDFFLSLEYQQVILESLQKTGNPHMLNLLINKGFNVLEDDHIESFLIAAMDRHQQEIVDIVTRRWYVKENLYRVCAVNYGTKRPGTNKHI